MLYKWHVYDWLLPRVVRGRLRKTSTSTYNSITFRIAKEDSREEDAHAYEQDMRHGVFHKFLLYFRVVKHKVNVGFWDQLAVCMCIPPNNFWTPELIFMKIGMCIMPPDINLFGVARDKSRASVIPALSPIDHTIQIMTLKLLECLSRSLWNWYECRATWGHRNAVLNKPLPSVIPTLKPLKLLRWQP